MLKLAFNNGNSFCPACSRASLANNHLITGWPPFPKALLLNPTGEFAAIFVSPEPDLR